MSLDWQIAFATMSIIGTLLSGFTILIWKSSRWVARIEARCDGLEDKADNISGRLDGMWCALSRMFPERFHKVADG